MMELPNLNHNRYRKGECRISWSTLNLKTWRIIRPGRLDSKSKEMSSSWETECVCLNKKNSEQWKRSLKLARRPGQSRNCRRRTMTSSNDVLLMNKDRKWSKIMKSRCWWRSAWSLKRMSAYALVKLPNRSFHPSWKLDHRRVELKWACKNSVKRTLTELLRKRDKSWMIADKESIVRTNSLERKLLMLVQESTARLMFSKIKSQLTKQKLNNSSAWRQSCCRNCKRHRKQKEMPLVVWSPLWSMLRYPKACVEGETS